MCLEAMMASDGLRERLTDAKLAGTNVSVVGDVWGYRFRSNEGAADIAVKEVAAWLRDEADKLTKIAGEENDPTVKMLLLAKAGALESRARSLDGEQIMETTNGA